jgi:hypothetical protein
VRGAVSGELHEVRLYSSAPMCRSRSPVAEHEHHPPASGWAAGIRRFAVWPIVVVRSSRSVVLVRMRS